MYHMNMSNRSICLWGNLDAKTIGYRIVSSALMDLDHMEAMQLCYVVIDKEQYRYAEQLDHMHAMVDRTL